MARRFKSTICHNHLAKILLRWLFYKAITRVAVVVDGVLGFQLLNISELALGRRAGDAVAERLAGVEQDFFETTRQAHAFVRSKIMEQSGEAFLQTQGNLHTLNFDGRLTVVNVMPEIEEVPMQVSHGIVAQSVWPVLRRHNDFNAVGAMKFMKLISVAADEIHRATTGLGCAILQEYLHLKYKTRSLLTCKEGRLQKCRSFLDLTVLAHKVHDLLTVLGGIHLGVFVDNPALRIEDKSPA